MTMPVAQSPNTPRIIVAGLGGDSGKTLVSIGICRALVERGMTVSGFKKGPDFIDSGWLQKATRRPGRNLDTFLMSAEAIRTSLAREAERSDVSVIEGNRGLFDGFDSSGTHSTAELARVTQTPCVLVVDVTKVTRTVAALVKGCLILEPDVPLAAVILNRVATARQERVIRESLQQSVGIPVVGALPRLDREYLPGRHLGLLTAAEHPQVEEVLDFIAATIRSSVDLDAVLKVGASARSWPVVASPGYQKKPASVRIGVLQDAAFSFYYPENLEALEREGAILQPVSPLGESEFPQLDGLYAGGGFPEVYAEALAGNTGFREGLRRALADGLPVWAECGGLIYLSEGLRLGSHSVPMAQALPVHVEQLPRPQGHGYVEGVIDREDRLFELGEHLRGHEFHYTRICEGSARLATVMDLSRGTGIGAGRDGIRCGSVFASYTHLHALSSDRWAQRLVAAAGGR
ncbi:MAG: cobyrinate a,c-diamide synthase [Acidobacteriota bacterium]|nr:MAG: cobyrinate a,c-diamide synthase [Acidobacteriota bacterium]